jgi:dienelactone hydrolase
MVTFKTPAGRFSELPSALSRQSRSARLGASEIPALLAHPDWQTKTPAVIWMHGRTVSKEIDPGRYLRWIRSGVAAIAIDLPGHGERLDRALHQPERTLDVVHQGVSEIDEILAELTEGELTKFIDAERLAIGGMSAGGMVTLRRLADPHPFVCAAVESTAGDFALMPSYQERYDQSLIDELNPVAHADRWRPIPLLALHSEKDEWVPVDAVRSLFVALRERYEQEGADAELTLKTWPETGAPYEHAGFGKVAAEAKDIQVAFLRRHLR